MLNLIIISDKHAVTTILTASVGGVVAVFLLIFSLYIFTKYRLVIKDFDIFKCKYTRTR